MKPGRINNTPYCILNLLQRCPLEHVVLNAKLLDMGEPKALLSLAIDAPDENDIEYAVLLLKEVVLIRNSNELEGC